jgi:transposase
VVWDNASFHKSAKAKKMIEDAGCKLIFLPPYSPDLNPIEHFWSNFKRYLRKTIAACPSLWDAIVNFFKIHINCTTFRPV